MLTIKTEANEITANQIGSKAEAHQLAAQLVSLINDVDATIDEIYNEGGQVNSQLRNDAQKYNAMLWRLKNAYYDKYGTYIPRKFVG